MRWMLSATATLVTLTCVSAQGPAFRLRDAGGKVWSQDDVKAAPAVVYVFLGTQCPVNNAYLVRLNELHAEFAKQGVPLLGVNSNEQDSAADVKAHAEKMKIAFPVLRDEGHRLADALGAERTPEAFVVDPGGAVKYRGRIDDQIGVGFQRPAPTKRDLADAVAAVLAGKAPAVAKTSAPGCLLGRAPRPKTDATITYAKQVAPILQNRCAECHRPGQIGPMPLLSYDDASSWSAMIHEVVSDRRMPPWHADPKHGTFANDRRLPDVERDTLLAWIAQGCPPGDLTQAPPPKKYADGWTIGTPDAVFEMPRKYDVPAKAPTRGIPYQYVTIKTNFAEDRWVQAAEARPGNRAVVHHILVYLLEDRKAQAKGDGIGRGLLVAYAPGDFGSVYPAGSAKKLPKGSTLLLQLHYTPNGIAQSDRSSVGLVFAKEPPVNEVRTRAVAQTGLWLWPKRDNQRAAAFSTFTEDVLVWSLTPHMHLRGKSFQYDAVHADGRRETLLSVPRYDFNWQASYRLSEPLALKAGSRIECTAVYDNSEGNPNNPDPTRTVRWGDQTWEEMMIGFVDYTTRK